MRTDGFYWVRTKVNPIEWIIAQWILRINCWAVIDHEGTCSDDQFIEIDTYPIARN